MKSVYWRPQRASRKTLVAIGVMSVCGLLSVEILKAPQRQDDYELKMAAARRAAEAMAVIKQERLQRGHQFSSRFDPGQTGLIGDAMTTVTSLPASLSAKQTSVNPNYAAAVVDMLRQAGIEKGDCVAVGYTGSFPAFDLCVCAALATLEVRPIAVASVASSQFGANDPDFLWLDMERLLYEKGLISFRSTAASLGGYGDRGRGMSDDAVDLLIAAVQRNELPLLKAESLAAAIDQRMQIYRDGAEGRPIKAYINVGGGAASLRGATGRELFLPGLNLSPSIDALRADSVMARFALQGMPVINMVRAEELAGQYGFECAPASMPVVGTGQVFVRSSYRRWLAAAILLAILATLHSFVLSGLHHRISAYVRRRRYPTSTEDVESPSVPELQLMV